MQINKVLLIGAVASTAATLEMLAQHEFDVVGVLGHEPEDRGSVSGWRDLRALASRLGLDYKSFRRINDPQNLDWARAKQPDLVFAVGFSQLLSPAWLGLPTIACVGFHPTCLPRGRGRAPIAWIILEERQGAATFFVMDDGADSGPILVQHRFPVLDSDDAASVECKIIDSIHSALNEWLPKVRLGEWNPVPQDETQATWYGRRGPEDSLIDWRRPASEIDRLIKASAPPHPGAYTYLGRTRLVIRSSCIEGTLRMKGVAGRILALDRERGFLTQTGDTLLWINHVTSEDQFELKIGQKLGLSIEDEIAAMWKYLDRFDG